MTPIFLILILSYFFNLSNTKHNSKIRFRKRKDETLCPDIYALSEKLVNFEAERNYAKSYVFKNFIISRDIFPKIKIDRFSAVFTINAFEKDTEDYKEMQFINSAFTELKVFPNYNFNDIKKCCLREGKLNGKKIYEEVCFPLVIAFIKYRFLIYLQYIERAFQEGMRNLEYVVGEIPLDDYQKHLKMMEKLKKKDKMPFSIHWMKIMNPTYIYKGGQKRVVDEDNFDLPNKEYFESEFHYIQKLRSKLEQGCSISFFVPIKCEEYIRVCHKKLSTIFLVLNREGLKFSEINGIAENDDLSQNCFSNGYELYCTNGENFKNLVYGNNEEESEKISEKKIYDIPDELRMNSIRIETYIHSNIIQFINFKVKSFQGSMIKNYNLQRLILDNYNNRYQNDMYSLGKGEQCISSYDCLGISVELIGYHDSQFNSKAYTGLEEVDKVFSDLKIDKLIDFHENKFYVSVALGNMPFLNVWKLLKSQGQDTEIEHEFNVNFEDGILGEFGDYAFTSNFYYPMIEQIYQAQINEEKLNDKNDRLSMEEIEIITKNIASYMRNFTISVKDTFTEIRTILNKMNSELGVTDQTPQFLKSVRSNELYSLFTLEAIEDASKIQPEIGVAINVLRKFNMKIGLSLIYSQNLVYNEGASKIMKRITNKHTCSNLFESTFMFAGRALEKYNELYPSSLKGDYNSYSHYEALIEFFKFLRYFYRTIIDPCVFLKMKGNLMIFFDELKKNGYGYIDDDSVSASLFDDIVEYSGPKFFESYNLRSDYVKENIFNLQIFSDIQDSMKKFESYNGNIQYIPELLKMEKIYLTHIKGYEIGNKKKNLPLIAKMLNFTLKTLTITYFVNLGVWDHIVNKNSL